MVVASQVTLRRLLAGNLSRVDSRQVAVTQSAVGTRARNHGHALMQLLLRMGPVNQGFWSRSHFDLLVSNAMRRTVHQAIREEGRAAELSAGKTPS